MSFKTSAIFLILSIIVLLLLAHIPIYQYQLLDDLPFYIERSKSFLRHLNLSHLEGNEYQPGAIVFFIILSPFLHLGGHTLFMYALFGVNILLLFVHAYLYVKNTGYLSLIIFSILLLATGPITFFRFDLVVTVLVVSSFFFWLKKREYLSIILLAFGTLVKVYPVIFLPYLLILAFKNSGFKKLLKLLLIYIVSISVPIFAYIFILGAKMPEIYSSLQYHKLKPLGLESVWASMISLISLVNKGHLPNIIARNGIWGINDLEILLPLWFYDYAWVLPLFIFYIYLLGLKKPKAIFDVSVPLIVLTIFFIFAKVYTPQYMLWLVTLIPILKYQGRKIDKSILGIFILILLLYQIIYPLNYYSWVEDFSSGRFLGFLFFVNTLRNGLLILFCFFLIKRYAAQKK